MLTPRGDTHGIFVAAMTADSFIVRESHGGHATVSFDYRILATALGQAGQRMATNRDAALHVALPPVPTMKLPPVTPPLP